MVLNGITSGIGGVGGSQTYQALYSALTSTNPQLNLAGFGLTDESYGTPGAQGMPAISYVASIAINVQGETMVPTMNSSRVDTLEALLNSAVNSGTLSAALGVSNFSATAPTSVQTQRATREAAQKTGCPVCKSATIDEFCAAQINQTAMYRDVSIAFIVGFGCLVLGFFSAMCIFSIQLRTARARSVASRKTIPQLEMGASSK